MISTLIDWEKDYICVIKKEGAGVKLIIVLFKKLYTKTLSYCMPFNAPPAKDRSTFVSNPFRFCLKSSAASIYCYIDTQVWGGRRFSLTYSIFNMYISIYPKSGKIYLYSMDHQHLVPGTNIVIQQELNAMKVQVSNLLSKCLNKYFLRDQCLDDISILKILH